MPSYKAVSTSIPSYTIPFGYKLGNALSALGGTMGKFASFTEELEEKNKLKKANEEAAKLMSGLSDQDSAAQGMWGAGDTVDLEGKIPGEVRSLLAKPSLDTGSFGSSALAGMMPKPRLNMTTPSPEWEAEKSMVRGHEGVLPKSEVDLAQAHGGAVPTEQNPYVNNEQNALQTQQLQQLQMKGFQDLAASVPKDVLGKELAMAQKLMGIYFKAGKPEVAMELMKHRLDVMKSVYGADTSALSKFLAIQAGLMRAEKSGESAERVARIGAGGRAAGKVSDEGSRDLASLTSRANTLTKQISDKENEGAPEDEIAPIREKLSNIEAEYAVLLEERKKRRGVLPTRKTRTVAKVLRNTETGQVKTIYSDGTEEIK